MNTLRLILAAALLAAPAFAAPAQGTYETTGRFIVRLNPAADARRFDRSLKQTLARDTSAGPGDNQLVHQYTMRGARGYAGTFTPAVLDQLRNDPNVAGIEEDVIGWLDEVVEPEGNKIVTQPDVKAWGLTRVHQRKLNLAPATYAYPESAGEGVTSFVIDSGINFTHPDFGGRASWGANFVAGEPDEDLNGHGTHCAGTIASEHYGVAKKAKVVAVKVCSKAGRCATSDVVAGIQFVIKNAVRMKTTINISLGLAPSDTIDAAVKAAVDAGIMVVVSGGNNNESSCLNSPRRAKESFAVGASTNDDSKASFSNHGECLKIFAPGKDILSTLPGDKTGVKSGTSMASPHVCGIAALYLAANKYNSIYELHADMIKRSTKQIIKGAPANTTTNLVYSLPSGGEADDMVAAVAEPTVPLVPVEPVPEKPVDPISPPVVTPTRA